MAYGTTIGDAAISGGFPLIAPTDDAQKGYDHHNETRDFLAESITEMHEWVSSSDRIPPAYAGARDKPYSRALALYNGGSTTMITARARIARAKRGDNRCRITFIGDSRTRGAGIAPIDGQRAWQTYALPSQFRELIGGRMGEIYFDPQDDRITAVSGFAFSDADFAANQLATTGTSGSSVTIILPQACTGFDLWIFRTGTTALASISVDGAAAETFAPGAGASWKRFEKRGLANTVHTVTITIPPLAVGSFTLSRIAPYYGETALTVTNAGRSSSRPLDWDATGWNYLLPTVLDPNGYRPDVVFMQIGTNWGASTYANLTSIVTKLRAAGSQIILVGFGPRSEDATDPVFNTRRGLMYDLADEFDLPLIDHLQVIGEWEVADSEGAMTDLVHESAEGQAREAYAEFRAVGVS